MVSCAYPRQPQVSPCWRELVRPALKLTSIPPWATTPTRPDADLSGRSWTVVAIGLAADEVVAHWTAQLTTRRPDLDVCIHRVDSDEAARRALDEDLARAVIGWRLMIAGPADACLRLRAHALRSGVADDELTVASVDVSRRDVACAHCRSVTSGVVQLEEVLACSGCGRNLLVYYHVSRRLGAHLGFVADPDQLCSGL